LETASGCKVLVETGRPPPLLTSIARLW